MLTFVTGNANKLHEVQQILDGLDVQSHKIDLDELQGTYAVITSHKAAAAAAVVGGPAIVDDTALEFDAYGGELPGPYIKWFLGKLGPNKLPRMLDGFESRQASAVCCVGYCEGPGKEPKVFIGKTPGTIVEPRGLQTFGWDCTFEPQGYNQTYAEMDKAEKNRISHRGKAITMLKEYLNSRE